jgi:acyl carrier protein
MANIPFATATTMEALVRQIQRQPIPANDFGPHSRFVADLGMKSLELIGLVFICEQTFGVSLVSRPGLLARLQSVGEAIEAIRLLQNGSFPEELVPNQKAS